jgi:hypothetical protein
MTADHILTLAASLRTHARASGRDINAANLFVHTVLMRAIKFDGAKEPPAPAQPQAQAAHAAEARTQVRAEH